MRATPELSIDPDGEIAFDWRAGDDLLSMSLAENGRLSYAWTIGGQQQHGVITVSLPTALFKAIERFAGSERTPDAQLPAPSIFAQCAVPIAPPAPAEPVARVCDACKGSGEGRATFGSGQDACEVPTECEACGGAGKLAAPCQIAIEALKRIEAAAGEDGSEHRWIALQALAAIERSPTERTPLTDEQIERLMARIDAYASSFHVDAAVGRRSVVTDEHRTAIRRFLTERASRSEGEQT